MSSILKSSVVKNKDIRIINGEDIVAKKLESLAQEVRKEENEEFADSFIGGIKATSVAELIQDEVQTKEDALFEDTDHGESKMDLQAVNQAASDVLQRANEEAKTILENARLEAETIRKNAFEQAKEDGLRQGMELAQAKIREEEAKYKELEDKLSAEYQSKLEELEPRLVDAITDVYEYLFKVELSDNKEIVVHLINSALSGLAGNVNKFRVFVSKDDFAYISMQKKTILSGTGVAAEQIEFVEDSALIKGNCMIETDNGIYDCSVQTQLGNLKKDLILLSYSNE